MDASVPIVLASRSPTRKRLLLRLVRCFEVDAPRVDESALAAGSPSELARRRAVAKAREVAKRRPGALIIAADTLTVCAGETLGKPAGRQDAVRILRRLTARPHEVITAVCLRGPAGRELCRVNTARVEMRQMDEPEIEALASRPGALEKAGAYALEPGDPNVVRLQGDPTTVMGLPLDLLRAMMVELYEAEEE
ncbi:MAG: Maf family nucleotide pyrophosphatase [Candidatus Brocadiia bacterium]